MRKYIALVSVLALGACQTVGQIPAPTPVVGQKLTIAQVAGNDFATACQVFRKASGYYMDIAPAIALMAPAQNTLALTAIDAGDALCAVNPANVITALTKLNTLWVRIQAFTTVPK